MKLSSHSFVIFILLAIPLLVHAEDKKPAASWTDKIKISGDFRYRYEFIGREDSIKGVTDKVRIYDRNRNRLRFRLGIGVDVNNKMTVNARIATAMSSGLADNFGGDPVSNNQDLTGGAAEKPVWLDRACLDYHPSDKLSLRAGKQPVPFENSDLFWSPDVNPEGVSVLGSYPIGKSEIFGRAGGFWMNEVKPNSTKKHALTQGLFAGQLGGKINADKLSCVVAVAYYDYGNVKNNPLIYNSTSGFGNTVTAVTKKDSTLIQTIPADTLYTVAHDTLIIPSQKIYQKTETKTYAYKYDYNLLNVKGEVKYKSDKLETTIGGDFVMNTAAENNPDRNNKKNNVGWMAGFALKFRKMPLPVDWDLAYNYRVLQADAAIGAMTDPTPAGGGTNYNGHKFVFGVMVLPGTRLGFTYYRNVLDNDNSNTQRQFTYDRVQADVEVKF